MHTCWVVVFRCCLHKWQPHAYHPAHCSHFTNRRGALTPVVATDLHCSSQVWTHSVVTCPATDGHWARDPHREFKLSQKPQPALLVHTGRCFWKADDSSRNVFAIPGLKKRKLRIQQKREMIVDGERWQSSQEGIKSMPRWRFCFGFGDTASTNKDGGRRRCLFSFMASLQISSSNSTEQVKSYKKNCLLFIDAYARYVYLTHVL